MKTAEWIKLPYKLYTDEVTTHEEKKMLSVIVF